MYLTIHLITVVDYHAFQPQTSHANAIYAGGKAGPENVYHCTPLEQPWLFDELLQFAGLSF